MSLHPGAMGRLLAVVPRPLRYLIVGGAVGLLWLVLSNAMLAAGLAPFVVGAASFVACTPLSYAGHRWVTFESDAPMTPEARRYLAKALAGLMLSAAVTHLALVTFALPRLAGLVVTSVVVPVVGFLLSRHWVFRRTDSTPIGQVAGPG